MPLEKTDALVIRLADWSESSRVVTLFTRDFGRISALARGVKRFRSSFEAALDLLSESRIVFLRKSSSSLDILTESQLISRFQPSSRSLTSLYGGYYVAELLAGLCEEYDPHPRLYQIAIDTLRRLESDADARPAILRFELVILRESGHLPEFEACLVCGAPVADDRRFAYWVSQGGLICTTCQRPDYNQVLLDAGALAVLKQLSADDPVLSHNLAHSAEQLAQLRHLTTAAVTHVLERRPSTLRYLNFD